LIHVFHGSDDFSISEKFEELKKALGDGEALAVNTTVLEGRDIQPSELLNHCRSMPFLGDRRLVIVKGLLGRFDHKKKGDLSSSEWDSLDKELEDIPSSTELVFIDGDIAPNNRLLRKLAPLSSVHWHRLPVGPDLEKWIVSRVTRRGGKVSPRAAHLLGELAGDSLWTLIQEIEKLCLYANGRLITDKDVRMMTIHVREASVFALVDAIIEMRTSTAMQLLHRLIDEGASPSYVLSMLSRQLRLMLQARELQSMDLSPTAKREALRVSPRFRVDRLMDQSSKYPISRLVEVYAKVLETDLAIKTGRWRDDLAMDLLVADLSARQKVNA